MSAQIADIIAYLDEKKIEYHYIGNMDLQIDGFSSINRYVQGTMTWIKNENYIPNDISFNECTLVIAPLNFTCVSAGMIKTKDPKYVFFNIIEQFLAPENELPAIGHNTYISEHVKIGENVRIGHNCSIDGDIEIGDNTVIYNNVSLINSIKIGKDCVIQSCVNIGHDGFGFTEDVNHKKTMVKHYGGVQIGSNVYIGGNTYIERGTIDNTVIQDGSKIDGGCVIGHNSIVRENSALVTGTLLFGSVDVGEGAYIASATIRNQISVGKNALVGMGAVVTKDLPDNIVVAGNPAKQFK